MLLDLKPETRSATIGGVLYTLAVGVDQQARPTVTITSDRPGGALLDVMGTICKVVTVGLRNGVPASAYAKGLRWQRFEPCGKTGDEGIPECASLVDYLAQLLERCANGQA